MIVLEQVSKRFGEVPALERISLDVPASGSVAILGQSGSGKTTLLRLIAGLDVPDEGKIYLGGKLVSKPGWVLAANLRGVGFMFQTPALWPHMTVAQNILFGLGRLPKREARLRLQQILSRTTLTELSRRYPYQLSGGEARCTALARTLAPEPRCLLLDEPLVNLHQAIKDELLKLIRGINQANGTTLVYVSHDKSEAAKLCESMLVLEHGRLIKGGGQLDQIAVSGGESQ